MNQTKLSGTTGVARSTISMVVLVSLVLFLNIMGVPAMAQDVIELGRFEETECPMMLPGDVNITCGYLSVPEVHGDANSRTIKLAVAILHSRGDQPQLDPVVFLHGGPGQGALQRIFLQLNSPYLAARDLILVDQRGVGFSEPSLTCPEVDKATLNSIIEGRNREEVIADDVAAAASCRDRLQNEGIILAAYNTLESAADFENLRMALGYDQWNLYGQSYGTLLAQTMMRLYPDAIRSVTMEAVMPLQQTVEETVMFGRALDEVFDSCANDAACSAAYPQLADQFRVAVERLNAQPVTLRVEVQRNGALVDVPMDGELFANILFLQLYSPANIPFVPFIIQQVAAGNGQVMTIPAAQTLRLLSAGADTGDRFSVTCQDIVPFAPVEDGTQTTQQYPYLAGVQIMTSWSIRSVCETWGISSASSDFSQPVNSDIPTLLLHGQYDPRLTTDYAFEVAQTLPNSYAYIVPGVSHQATLSSCAQTIAMAFINVPTQEPAAGCLAEVAALQFVLPRDIHATPAMINLVKATIEPPNPLMLGLLVLCLLIFVGVLISTVRGKTQTSTIRWLSALVALLNIITLLVLIGIVLTSLSNSIIIGFGIPGSVSLIRFLPLVTGAFAVALTVMLVVLWLRRIPGTRRGAIFTSAVAIAGLFVSVWLLTLGLLP